MPCRASWANRHWFTYYGQRGSSSPVCVRHGCNAPNPDYRPEDDPRQTQIEVPTPQARTAGIHVPAEVLGQPREDAP